MEYEPCLENGKRLPLTETDGPDGVEAWLVAVAALYINFIMAGIGRVSGILFIEFIDAYSVGRYQASLPISVRSSIRSLFGPIVGILGQKYGPRPVMITGGVIGSLSAAVCFFLDDIYWITVMWGVVSGIGAALTTTLPQVLIGQHFKKYRTTASGMSFSGGCVGSFVFPYLIEHVLYEYALGGTYLIISGIMMNVIPASFILKSPSWLARKRERIIQIKSATNYLEKNVTKFDSNNEVKERNGDCGKCLLQNNEFAVSDADKLSNGKVLYCEQLSSEEQILKNEIDTEFLLENGDIVFQLLTNCSNLQSSQINTNKSSKFPVDDALVKEIETFFSKIEENHYKNNSSFNECRFAALKYESELVDNCKQLNEINFVNDAHKSNDFIPQTNLKSLDFLSLSLENLFENDRKNILKNFSEERHEIVSRILGDLWHLHELLSKYNASYFPPESLLQNSMYLEGSLNSVEGEKSNTFSSHIKTALEVHRKPIFILICLCRSVHFLTFLPMVTIVVDFAKDRGFLTEEGTFIINILSLGDLMGRLCFGWVTDKGFVTLPRYMLFIMILQGIATISLPLMKTRATIVLFIFAFGLLQGSVFVRHPVLVSRYLKTHEQSIAMGCMDFFSGLIGFTIPVYIGFFRDTVGAYDGIFYVNGSIGVFVGFLWFFEPFLLKIYKPHLKVDQV